jgi:hypothetical protein
MLSSIPKWFGCPSNESMHVFFDSVSLCQTYKKLNNRTISNSNNTSITVDEEQMIRKFYHSKIKDICAALDYSIFVQSDAHIFLHRYFIKYGILEFDIKHAMYS